MAKHLTLKGILHLIPRILAVLTVVSASAFPLDMQYIPTIPSLITDPSLGRFDLFGKGIGPPMFVIAINNGGDNNSYTNLQIHYTVSLHYKENGVDRTQTIYEGNSNIFSMEPNESVMIPSSEFLKDRNPNVRASLMFSVYELDNLTLKDRMQTSQRIPDGTLSFSLQLLQRGSLVAEQEHSHEVINAITIDLLAPGKELDDQPSNLYTPRPLFAWTSQLYPGIYGSGEVFELRIYEARPGESSSDALGRLPVFTSKVNAFQFQYPANGRQLVPGYTYYWEVTGLIKGAATSSIRSAVYGFKLLPVTDPKVLEVLALLQVILDRPVLDQVDGYVSGVSIRINNAEAGTAQLRETVLKIQAGEFSLVNAFTR